MTGGRIPKAVKLGYTLWMLLWVPVVLWAYGPANFLWLCNVAQFLLLYAIWREDPLVVSSQAGIMTLVGGVWTLDFVVALIVGGGSPTGATGYMFDPAFPLPARLVSLFHVALPVLVVWLCHRLGHDRRGLLLEWPLAVVLTLAGWLFTDPERNINYAFAPFGIEQVWFPHGLYLALLTLVATPLLLLAGELLVRWLLDRLRR